MVVAAENRRPSAVSVHNNRRRFAVFAAGYRLKKAIRRRIHPAFGVHGHHHRAKMCFKKARNAIMISALAESSAYAIGDSRHFGELLRAARRSQQRPWRRRVASAKASYHLNRGVGDARFFGIIAI